MNTVSPDTIQKLKEVSNQVDILEIEIISSLSNQKGEKIKINSLGMIEKSKRKAYDGLNLKKKITKKKISEDISE